MENTGNSYDDSREGHTTQANAITDAQAEDSQTKISDSRIKKWASRIFTTLAIIGWTLVLVLIVDVKFNNSQIICWIMIGK